MSIVRLLFKPTLFTVGVCGTCFCTTAIVQHERRKHSPAYLKLFPLIRYKAYHLEPSGLMERVLELRYKAKNAYDEITTAQTLAACNILINLLVFGAWRTNAFKPVLMRFFLSRVDTPKMALSPMVLSCFSHANFPHLAFNMFAMYSFSETCVRLLGPEQLVGLYLSAGVVSSLASMAYRLSLSTLNPSLGASGALLGVIAYVCTINPDSQVSILFLVTLASGTALKGLMAFDLVCAIARFKLLDHACHLGGALTGVWYAKYGQKLYQKHREDVVDTWLRLKTRGSSID